MDDSVRQEELGERFAFVGEALPLDLVNTEQVVRGKPVDLLAHPGDLAAWWRVAAVRYPATLEPLTDAAALLPPS